MNFTEFQISLHFSRKTVNFNENITFLKSWIKLVHTYETRKYIPSKFQGSSFGPGRAGPTKKKTHRAGPGLEIAALADL